MDPVQLYVGLGKRIREARDDAGLSQVELADQAGVHVNSITKLEAGKVKRPALEVIVKIAGALGLSLDYLVLG